MPDPWAPVIEALDRAAAEGRTIRVWLRDDDAVSVTPALERLTALCAKHAMPVLLAIIPEPAEPGLPAFCARHPGLIPAQHGFRHVNHAAPGEKARELGGTRAVADILDDLRSGRAKLSSLFGQTCDVLVPPWNRIDPDLLPALPGLGFRALSTFGPPSNTATGLVQLNCDIDPIDWREGKVCRPHDRLLQDLQRLIGEASGSGRPIGLLTHHLVHDQAAWEFCEAALSHLGRHGAVRFAAAHDLFARSPAVAQPR